MSLGEAIEEGHPALVLTGAEIIWAIPDRYVCHAVTITTWLSRPQYY